MLTEEDLRSGFHEKEFACSGQLWLTISASECVDTVTQPGKHDEPSAPPAHLLPYEKFETLCPESSVQEHFEPEAEQICVKSEQLLAPPKEKSNMIAQIVWHDMLNLLQRSDPLPSMPCGDDTRKNLLWICVGISSDTLDFGSDQCFDNEGENKFFDGEVRDEASRCVICLQQALNTVIAISFAQHLL